MEIETIIKWFEENSELTKTEITQNLEKNYLLLGWIDSLKFVSFVSFLEETFKIRFSNDEFQNPEFSSINGLMAIIKGKLIE
jgi:acyl carrier protein